MRKTRLYLDTSPIIMLEPDQDPTRQAITKDFFRIVAERTDEYELFISTVTLDELQTGEEDHGENSILYLDSLAHTELPGNKEAENLAQYYISNGVLSKGHLDDLRHVAYAVVARCAYIITWNMKHLANERTVSRVNIVNSANDYGKIFIATPEFFTGGKIYEK